MMQAPNRQILRGARANDIPVERSTRFEFVINLKTAKVLRQGLRQILEWRHETEPAEGVGLDVILTDGEQKVGSRFGRTLYYYVEREGVRDCEICGFPLAAARVKFLVYAIARSARRHESVFCAK